MVWPIGVLTVYAALIVWAGLLVQGLRAKSFDLFLWFGLGLMLFLNIGYFIFGVPASIANFIGIYDVLINIGLAGNPARSNADKGEKMLEAAGDALARLICDEETWAKPRDLRLPETGGVPFRE